MNFDLPFSSETAERLDALYQYLSRKYRVKELKIPFSEREFRLIVVESIDDLLRDLVKSDPNDIRVKDERLPYWADVWPSALALSRFILENDPFTEGASAVELGCGLGLVGMTTALKGAQVLLTDYEEDALRFAELNWLINLGKSPATAQMDWRYPEIASQFEFIIASDVAYEKRFFRPLTETFHKLLAPAGRILLSEPNREIATGFFELLKETGFGWNSQDIPITFRKKKTMVSVYEIWK